MQRLAGNGQIRVGNGGEGGVEYEDTVLMV
jgi:hypothetical protein